MLADFVSLVVSGVAAAASAFDAAASARYVAWLEPLAALPRESIPYRMREYCLAIADTAAGKFGAASARYAQIVTAFSQPVEGVREPLRQAIYLGALNGRGQCEVSSTTPLTLEIADELGRGDPFYAPHAECARMAYYGLRGEKEEAELHRARAELLALRGGTSWSAVTVLTARLAYAAAAARDAIALVQAIAELDRLSTVAPKLATCKLLSEAWLEHLRGHDAESIALYERVIDTEDARGLMFWRADRTQFAAVLNHAGQYERAKALCEPLCVAAADSSSNDVTTVLPWSQVAIAEAHLGNVERATQLLDQVTAALLPLANPLQLGAVHAERARVALLAVDRESFDEHFAQMEYYFRSTRNASLIQQCDALLTDAVRVGVRMAAAKPVGHTYAGEIDPSTVVEQYAAPERENDLNPGERSATGV